MLVQMVDGPSELVPVLGESVRGLRESGHGGWAHRMERALAEITACNAHGLDIVLNACGGTADISDLPSRRASRQSARGAGAGQGVSAERPDSRSPL
jgi:hypothetical protein